MGRKPKIDVKNLPPWFVVIEYGRADGTTYKKYKDTYNDKPYRSLDAVARAFGLGGNNIPCPKPLNIRNMDGSFVALVPRTPYTTTPAIPGYVAKSNGSDSSNFGEAAANGIFDDVHVPKKQRISSGKEKEHEETGHAASHFETEEEIAKKIDVPSADAASMKEK